MNVDIHNPKMADEEVRQLERCRTNLEEEQIAASNKKRWQLRNARPRSPHIDGLQKTVAWEQTCSY
jgi:hypothetical protein